jgi:hypothetical protein
VGGVPATAALLGISGGTIGADGLPGLVSAAFAVGLGAGWLLDARRAPVAPARPAYPDGPAHATTFSAAV